eukprot:GSMAST32.ASY1.ANO1.25.1 assembled CDS
MKIFGLTASFVLLVFCILNQLFANANQNFDSSRVANVFIVQLHEYLLPSKLTALIETIIGSPIDATNTSLQNLNSNDTSDVVKGWKMVERHNKVFREEIPTDFAVIHCSGNTKEVSAIIKIIKNSSVVRNVIPERRYFASSKVADIGKQFKHSQCPTNSSESESFSSNTHDSYTYFNPNIPNTNQQTSNQNMNTRKLLSSSLGNSRSSEFGAPLLWKNNLTGSGVKVGVLDTGIREKHPHILHLKERSNWTYQNSEADGVGHGTFCAGMISSSYPKCAGFAPNSEIYTFKVFTDNQASFSSWFLDALNYVLFKEIELVNLSIGGPDWRDAPFIDKIRELGGHGIVFVSAIGNDGPLYGTLMNPADHMEVIGVGGITNTGEIAQFSSRGATVHELPYGFGRVKPDIVVYAEGLLGSTISGDCQTLSGTSVAAPVVTGALALLMSIPRIKNKLRWNPGIMKQALIHSAKPIKGIIFEQGAGVMNLQGAADFLQTYPPEGMYYMATLFPSSLDFTDCPYMSPFCEQPTYYSAMPIVANVTILNGMGSHGYIEKQPIWKGGENGEHIKVQSSYVCFIFFFFYRKKKKSIFFSFFFFVRNFVPNKFFFF